MESPYPAAAPWPCMRGNLSNDGRARHGIEDHHDARIRHFRTGSSIFSTPIIGPDETIYVGSADRRFYAFEALSGAQRWCFEADEIIDSAACLALDGSLYVPAGDARIYKLSPAGQELWRFDLLARRPRFTPSTIYWWEANVVLGPNGWLYAGNDDFYLYAIDPEGELQWAAQTGLNIWAAPAFGPENLVFIASFDMHVYAYEQDSGRLGWKRNLENFIASSPALTADGGLCLGAFDGRVVMLDSRGGALR